MLDEREILDELNQERRRLARRGEIVEVLPSVTRVRAADDSYHVVTYASLTAHTADALIEEQIDHYARLGVDFEWKVYGHDAPDDMLRRLEGRGFQVGAREAVLVRERGEGDPSTAATAGSVSRIERVEQIADYRRVAEAVFGKSYDFTSNELAKALRAGCAQHRGYVAYDGETPVSIGRLYTHPDSLFAGLYGGATLPAFRGRGFYRALVDARARDAIALGARYLLVDALPTSRPILERMGFRRITDTWPCEWRRSREPRTRGIPLNVGVRRNPSTAPRLRRDRVGRRFHNLSFTGSEGILVAQAEPVVAPWIALPSLARVGDRARAEMRYGVTEPSAGAGHPSEQITGHPDGGRVDARATSRDASGANAGRALGGRVPDAIEYLRSK